MFVLANTIESLVIIPHILGTVIAPLILVYLTSYVFRFCAFHRIFIHYYAFIEILNVTDYYVRIPISDKAITLLHDGVTIAFIICAIYLYFKHKQQKSRPSD
jgi:Ca2+/Na+ antiporter